MTRRSFAVVGLVAITAASSAVSVHAFSHFDLDGDQQYTLHVIPSLGGYVTGPGIDCGDGGRTDCDEAYDTSTTVTMESFASSGYQFLAWGGNCSDGNATASVVVDAEKRCYAVFSPVPSGSAVADPSLASATLYIEWLGRTTSPTRSVWVGADSNVSTFTSGPPTNPSVVGTQFTSISSGETAGLRFRPARGGGPLGPGDFEQENQPGTGGMSVDLPGCFNSLNRFRIYQMTIDSSGQLLAFAADFEALCLDVFEQPTGSRVVGGVRINSNRARLVPYDGAYPVYKLKIQPASNGIVTAAGVDCGPARADCTETYPGATTVTLEAIPLPGYRFLGWSGACQGASTTTITVEWIHTCRAFFSPIFPGPEPDDARLTDRTLMIDSQLGDPIGLGRRKIWLDVAIDGRSYTADFLGVYVPTVDGFWRINFSAPNGQPLLPGTYENATGGTIGDDPPRTPVLTVYSRDGQCSTSGSIGRFVIYEISMFIVPPGAPDEGNQATSLAADFEIRCTPGGSPLRGSIRFHSTRTVLTPFAPAAFTPAPMPVRSDFDGDGQADLAWRHSVSGRNAVWLMDGINARVGTLLSPSGAASVPDLGWEIRAVADMNDDDRPDLIWQHSATGRIAVWFMSGTTRLSTNYLFDATLSSTEPDLDWKIVAAGDMDRDGHTDLVWRHRSSGEIRLWHMNGLVKWDSVALPTVSDTGWEIVDLADMNGDGMLDLVWRHSGHGRIASWFMFDALVQASLWMSPSQLSDTNWQIVGVVDMNNDQKPDLVWQNVATGALGVWFMDGTSSVSGLSLNPAMVSDPQWRIVGVK